MWNYDVWKHDPVLWIKTGAFGSGSSLQSGSSTVLDVNVLSCQKCYCEDKICSETVEDLSSFER